MAHRHCTAETGSADIPSEEISQLVVVRNTGRPENKPFHKNPESGIRRVSGKKGEQQEGDLDFEEDKAASIGINQARQVAAAMDWKILPDGAIARLRWNRKIQDVEVITVENLNASQEDSLRKLIQGVRERALQSAKLEDKSNLAKADNMNPDRDIITMW